MSNAYVLSIGDTEEKRPGLEDNITRRAMYL
jgi:hypothetical protein